MTINVARAWRQEDRLGSIEFGKLANMTVYDCDFLNDDIEKVGKANVVATIVDGGVSCIFDAGFPEHEKIHERIYSYLRKMDEQGKLPVHIEGCYILTNPAKTKTALEEVVRYNREFNTEHMKVHTFKILMDGTMKIQTAAMIEPYEGTDVTGTTTFDAEGLADVIKQLNELGMDLHIHTVGERASHVVLDAVELARKDLGESYRVKVTCAHLEVQDDADLARFAELGVIANYTPYWHAGTFSETSPAVLGEKRATHMYRCKTIWDSGALVTWSSDNVVYGDFMTWSPYLGMEVGMTRKITEKSRAHVFNISDGEFPPAEEKMSIEEMILGYTINGAIQLGIEQTKGSIEAGKDADYLVFDNDLLTAGQEGFSHNLPTEVYFCGKKVN